MDNKLRVYINQRMKGSDPYSVILRTVASLLALYLFGKAYKNARGVRQTILRYLIQLARKIPAVQSKVKAETDKVALDMKKGLVVPGEAFHVIPSRGLGHDEVLRRMREMKVYDESKYGGGKMSGCIYLGDDAHTAFANEAYSLFSISNPLHTDAFPNVRKFETEVIKMTLSMMHGPDTGCGAMTSGGTESILMAVKAYRDFARDKKGIKSPELIVPITVHAAFDKACYYFNIKLIHIALSSTMQVDVRKVEQAITKNTIAIVGSAPNFPHGMIDDIQALGKIAKRHKIGLHVDACLGGFLLPWVLELPEYQGQLPFFDFRVEGVTSMSADTHKYGYTPKGTSVVLFHNSDLRNYMFFTAPDWTGGIYGSPTMAGSRPGGLIAAAWGSLVSLGRDSYLHYAREIMTTSRVMLQGIKTIPELNVIGNPLAMVIAFESKSVDVFKINAAMKKRGWHLSSLQNPNGLHICVTVKHVGKEHEFIADLKGSVQEIIDNPNAYKNSSAAMYGMATAIPDRSIVKDIISGWPYL
eukprot:TRINITY_DN2357_c0_g1_i5.p1 TRINITY_DN2357_c0_g1~~TRINITY_DN2357_c0_g1_i5.p1  ORF type:complete len:527 (+),score=142.08 TRINITY_DN2357_c0_g1_i5:139-1719(+)